jgi:hypothetical protein
MKIIIFRFEKETINFIECDLHSGNLVTGEKEKIALKSSENRGEKYNKILDELLQIHTKYSPDILMYQSPQKYRGAIKDEEGFANSAILNLFCYQNSIEMFELTPVTIRAKLSIPNKEFKELLEKTSEIVADKYSISKTDKVFAGLLFLYLLKDNL